MCLQGRGDIQPQLDSAMQDVSDKYILLEETEKQALRKALIEDRQRFCCFVALLRPVVVSAAARLGETSLQTVRAALKEPFLSVSFFQDEEISMLGEVTHLQAISDDLKALTSDPHKLPPASEQVRPRDESQKNPSLLPPSPLGFKVPLHRYNYEVPH